MQDSTNGTINRPREAESGEALSALRRFARTRPAVERCELCGLALAPEHPHLFDRHSRQIACSCDACAILFSDQQNGKFLRVPRRVQFLQDFAFTDIEWEQMMLPINLAFFFRNAEGRITAMYPSPGGAIESQLGLDSWDNLASMHTALASMQPEVEALLVNRIGDEHTYAIVPIDACYRLVGLIRMKWHGLSGGTELWGTISSFFRNLGTEQVHRA
jgi:hypothetical protein